MVPRFSKEQIKRALAAAAAARNDPNRPPKKLTPLRAIKSKCLDCCCWNQNEVRLCQVEHCALWAYRLGHIPDDLTLENAGKKFEAFKSKQTIRP